MAEDVSQLHGGSFTKLVVLQVMLASVAALTTGIRLRQQDSRLARLMMPNCALVLRWHPDCDAAISTPTVLAGFAA